MNGSILPKQSLLNRTLFFSLIAALFLISACATRARFTPSSVVPAATGKVKVKKDNNNNYAIDVSVENLAEPERLPVPRSVYVVWAETSNGVENLGRLNTSKGLLSSKLKASLETVTPYKPTRIFITAEDAATTMYPGSYVVLNTNNL
jgi:hypothetical protein